MPMKGATTLAVLHGKEMSYNNWLDLDGAWQSAQDFPEPTVVDYQAWQSLWLCQRRTLAEAYEKAFASDPVSAFGGIVAVNRTMDAATAQLFPLFVEVVAAPEYTQDALDTSVQEEKCASAASQTADRCRAAAIEPTQHLWRRAGAGSRSAAKRTWTRPTWKIVSQQATDCRANGRSGLCLASGALGQE